MRRPSPRAYLRHRRCSRRGHDWGPWRQPFLLFWQSRVCARCGQSETRTPFDGLRIEQLPAESAEAPCPPATSLPGVPMPPEAHALTHGAGTAIPVPVPEVPPVRVPPVPVVRVPDLAAFGRSASFPPVSRLLVELDRTGAQVAVSACEGCEGHRRVIAAKDRLIRDLRKELARAQMGGVSAGAPQSPRTDTA